MKRASLRRVRNERFHPGNAKLPGMFNEQIGIFPREKRKKERKKEKRRWSVMGRGEIEEKNRIFLLDVLDPHYEKKLKEKKNHSKPFRFCSSFSIF